MPTAQDQFGFFSRPNDLRFYLLADAQFPNDLESWPWASIVGETLRGKGRFNASSSAYPDDLYYLSWFANGMAPSIEGWPRDYSEMSTVVPAFRMPQVRLTTFPLRDRLRVALEGGLGYVEILQRLAPEARAAGLGGTANDFAAAAAAIAAAQPAYRNAAWLGAKLENRDRYPDNPGGLYGRLAGLAESEARAIVGDARAAEWKARENATRAALGWPQPLAKISAAKVVAAAGKASPMATTVPLRKTTAQQLLAGGGMRLTPQPTNRMSAMTPRDLTVSGKTETGMWLALGAVALGVAWVLGKQRKFAF